MTKGVTGTASLDAFRAAVGVLRFAMETCRESGREGHDLPRAALDAAEAYLANPSVTNDDARAGYWGDLVGFEPTRPEEMLGADDQTRLATVAMTRGCRLACAFLVDSPGSGWVARTIIGNAAYALAACGWSPMHAWQEVMERFAASCPEVEL